jgi:hypothetical protein
MQTARAAVAEIEVAFAGRASDHQCAQPQEVRPQASHQPVRSTAQRGRAGEQILIEQEEGLDGANLALVIPDDEIPVREIGAERPLDQLVIPVILALAGKCAGPMLQTGKAGARDNLDATRRGRRVNRIGTR